MKLTPLEAKRLHAAAAERGVSAAELIRTALAEHGVPLESEAEQELAMVA